MTFVDAKNGWAAYGFGRVYGTSDGGTTWTLQLAMDASRDVYAVSFVDPDTGWAVGGARFFPTDYHSISRTTNGGVTWASSHVERGPIFRGVSFVDAYNGTIVGDVGTILHTTDGGANWTNQSDSRRLTFRGVSFADAKNGIAVGDEAGESGAILRTTDGGATWIPL